MNRNKSVKCKICGKKYVSKQALIDHIEKTHASNIPEGWNAARYENYLRTGKTEGRCVYCKKETGWNDATGKYNRMCGSEACKKKAREIANKNYIGLHGKPYTINDPEQQKKMVYGRKNSGKYIFEDEETGKKYTAMYDSSYGRDFFEMLDTFLNWDGSDIIAPSPHTYWYEYEEKKHFYIPDAYSTSLNLEIELKDGGDNPNNHPKIQAVDKVKEQKKDEVMASLKDQVNYIKICNKDYSEFFELLSRLKEKDVCQLPKWEGRLESITEGYISGDIVIETMGFNVYRVSYNGIGIYEALHKKLMEENKYDEWKKFLNSSDVNWLPKPPEYPEYYRSYFTEKGFNKFKSKTLPIMTKYLDKNEIKIEKSKYSGSIKYSDDYQIVVAGEPVEEVETNDSKLNRAESFSYYHLEEKQIKNGCWDEEQWFKTLPDAIKQELSQVSYKGVEGCTRKGNMTRFVYTLGKNNQTICLGRVNIYWYDWYDHTESPDYEWAETFGINMALIDEELNPIKGKTPILEDPLLEGKFKPINPNLIKRDLLLKDPMLNYDKLIDFYHKRLFHEKLNQKEWQYTYNELYKVREHLQKVVNKSSSENDKRMKYEAKKALVEVNNMIAYMEEKNTDRLPVSEAKIPDCIIVSCFAGVGKNYAINYYRTMGYKVDSIEKERNFYDKYKNPEIDFVKDIKNRSHNCDILFIPYYLAMESRHIKGKVSYHLIYPDISLKSEYIKRFGELGFTDDRIKYLSSNFKNMIDDCDRCKIPTDMKHKLSSGEYCTDIIDNLIGVNMESVSEAKELKKKPVYIISWHYNSLVGYSSRIATKSYYNHTSISLTPDLEKCYAFSRNPEFTKAESTNGFCNESLSYMIKRHRESVIKVDAVYLPENCVESIKKSIEYHEKHQADSKFDYINFGRIVLGIELKETNPNKMICSMFVDKLFKDAGVDLTNGKPSNLVTPADIAEISETNRNVITVYSGKAINYDKNKAGRITMESTLLESTKSSVDPDYKPKGKIKLSSLKRVRITESIINKYKKEYPFLKHVRCADTKEYVCDGYIWFDDDNLAAMVGSCEYTDDKTKWVVSLEITKDYKGYGLSPQILDYATKTMKCKYLSVNKNNKLAKKIYDDYGFKVYEESESMYYMTIDSNRKSTMEWDNKSIFETYINSSEMEDNIMESLSNITYNKSFKDVMNIVDTLSNADLNQICNGEFKDSPYVIYRNVLHYKGDPAAFIDIYKLDDDPSYNGCIVIACKSKYRRMGFTTMLIETMKNDKDFEWSRLIWECKKNNKNSELFAKKIGLKLTDSNNDKLEFSMYNEKSEKYSSNPLLDDIIKFNAKTNVMEYIIPNNGNIITNVTGDSFINNYKVLTPKEFEKYNGGVCWDYVIYEANYFNKNFRNVKYKTFFHCCVDGNMNPTHTFLLFYLSGKVYWFESSWKDHRGIYEFKNENEALSYISKELYDYLDDVTKKNVTEIFLTSYNPLDNNMYGMTCEEYMNYMSTKPNYNYTKKSNPKYLNKYIGKEAFDISQHITESTYEVIDEACKNPREARRFVQDVSKLAKKYNANYFLVTDGASGTNNDGNKAVEHCRNALKEWEMENGFNPDEDWRDNPNDFSEYRLKKTTESTFIEGTKDGTKYYPVFIFLSYTGTNMSKLIKSFTHDPYAHSSISFDTELEHMVSFNRDGMVEENIKNGIWKTNANIIKYSLYMYLATAEEYDAMRNFVNELLDKRNKLKYNLLGLTNFIFGRGSEREDRFFCSEFVSSVISAGNKNVIKTKPFMTSPYMLAKNKNFKFIKKGVLKNYNSKAVDNLIRDIMEEEGGFTDVIIK